MIIFPNRGLSRESREWLRSNTLDWSDRGVDPDRDLAEAREQYPIRVLGTPTLLERICRVKPSAVLALEASAPMKTRGHGREQQRTVRMRICATIDPSLDMMSSWYLIETHVDPDAPAFWHVEVSLDGGARLRHAHVNPDGLVCLGEGRRPFRQAVTEGRWGDAFTIIERVLRT